MYQMGRSMQAHLVFEQVHPSSYNFFGSVVIRRTTACLVFVHWAPWRHGGFSPGSAVVRFRRQRNSAGIHVQSMLSLSINLHRDLDQLIREGAVSELAQREKRGTLNNSDNSFAAHCLFSVATILGASWQTLWSSQFCICLHVPRE
jgi:hypothetical protein